MSERRAFEVDAPGMPGPSKIGVGSLPGRNRDHAGPRVVELGPSRLLREAREREDHWQEVELVLGMWERVARSWNNETLLRLARYASLEAETERDLENRAR